MNKLLACSLACALATAASAEGSPPGAAPEPASPDAGKGGGAAAASTPAGPLEAPPAPFTEADAVPLFIAGPFARARADLEAGRWDAAARGFEKANEPEAPLRRGRSRSEISGCRARARAESVSGCRSRPGRRTP
ncbi:MAG TPA: hypothetical protein VF904_04415 [Anaeromyxobacteraceae bacterium]